MRNGRRERIYGYTQRYSIFWFRDAASTSKIHSSPSSTIHAAARAYTAIPRATLSKLARRQQQKERALERAQNQRSSNCFAIRHVLTIEEPSVDYYVDKVRYHRPEETDERRSRARSETSRYADQPVWRTPSTATTPL